MAVLYFTNNADSGDGSLRDVITKAKSGDTIQPDEDAFAGLDLITIKTSSQLTINKTLGFDAMGTRVRIDGQSLSRLVAVSNGAEVEFIDFDFVRGVNTATCGGICATAANCRLVLQRCLIAGIKSAAALGAISTTTSSLSWSSVEAYDCIFTGLSGQPVTRSSSNWYYSCTIVGNVGNDSHINTPNSLKESATRRPSEMGFVVPPPDSISYTSWTDDAWESWDLRLRPESPFLYEADRDDDAVDFLRNERKYLGALGAIEGDWLVVDAARILNEETTVDYFEIRENGALFLGVPETAMKVRRGATFLGGSIDGVNSFIVVPNGTDASATTLTGTDIVQFTANVLEANATRRVLSWNAEAPNIPVVIQRDIDGVWTTVANVAGDSYTFEQSLAVGEEVRIYDGVYFTYVHAEAALTFHPWTVYANTISITTATETRYASTIHTAHVFNIQTGYILMSEYYNRGETPLLFARIQDSKTQEILDSSSIDSISYTAYRVGSSWGSAVRTPIEGFENLPIPASTVLSELVDDDPRWTKDSTGYNFIFEPNTRAKTLFSNAGDYVIVVRIEFAEANPLPIEFNISIS